MRKSIFYKLLMYMLMNVVLFTLLLYVANMVFANRYYVDHKKQLLIENSHKLSLLLKDSPIPFDSEYVIEIQRIERSIGGSITIGTTEGILYYSSDDNPRLHPGNGLQNPFFNLENIRAGQQLILPKGRRAEQVIIKEWEQQEDGSIFVRSEDPNLLIDTLRFQTILDGGLTLQIWVPMAEIHDSMSVSNSFTTLVGLITLFLTGIWSFIISKKFTRPITDMNRIAKKMLKLDFTENLNVVGEDELAQLSHTINTLSSKLSLTITELNAKNQQLEADIDKERQLDNLRKEFISNVSHELKTPIFLIQGYAEGLKDNVAHDAEKRAFYADVIIEEADKMDFIVKDLLNLSQMESGLFSITKCTFEIGGFVQDILRKMEPLLEEAHIHMDLDIEAELLASADPDRIEQVLFNYMTNAIHHVNNQRTIRVKVHKLLTKIRITVYNSGNVIPPVAQDKIWTSFYKVDESRARTYGGSGLGLSIVKNILEAHHNGYGFTNMADGVEFWFELDMAT